MSHRLRPVWVLVAMIVLAGGCRSQAATPVGEPPVLATPAPATMAPPPAVAESGDLAETVPATGLWLAVATALPPTTSGDTTPDGWAAHSSERNRFGLFLPPGWEMVELAGADVKSQLARVQERIEHPQVHEVLDRFRAGQDVAAAVALLVDEPPQEAGYVPNVSFLVAPADQISLDTYAQMVGRNLDQQGLATLLSAGLAYGWRTQGVPVARVEYVLDGAVHGTEDLEIRGQQVAFFDAGGGRLLIVTFTAPVTRFDELQPTFQRLVEGIAFP